LSFVTGLIVLTGFFGFSSVHAQETCPQERAAYNLAASGYIASKKAMTLYDDSHSPRTGHPDRIAEYSRLAEIAS